MAKMMIALVSEQRMQNLIPVFQRGASFEHVWLIRSTDADNPKSRFAQAWRDTTETLRNSLNVHSAEPSVGAYGIDQTRRVVADLLSKESGPVVVNFTGGTKCMSIGAYLAAQAAKKVTLYVDTANEKLVWFQPDARVKEEDFDLGGQLTVRIYLQANGKQIDEERTRQYALPQHAYGAARKLVALWPRWAGVLEAFGTAISQGRDLVSDYVEDNEATDILTEYGFIRRTEEGWVITQGGRAFLTGKWLDAMVHVLLEDSQFFDDVSSNLRLQGVENEIDILATRKGQLSIIECKSGDLGGQTTLNKLQAIRTGFGTFARAFFVTSREANQVNRAFQKRAREYGVREIITAESLLQVADIVKTRMRGTP